MTTLWKGGCRYAAGRLRRFKAGGLLARVGAEMRFFLQLLSRRGGLRRSMHVISLCPSILTVLGSLSLRARGGRHVTIVHDVQSGLGGSLGVGWLVTAILRRIESLDTESSRPPCSSFCADGPRPGRHGCAYTSLCSAAPSRCWSTYAPSGTCWQTHSHVQRQSRSKARSSISN